MPVCTEAVSPRAAIYTEDWASPLVCRTLGILAWGLLRAGWRVELVGLRRPDPLEVGSVCGRDLRWCSAAGVAGLPAFLPALARFLGQRAARFLAGRMSLSFARGSDLLICWSERIPPYCPAVRGWLIVPHVDRSEAEILTDVDGCGLRVSDREKQRRLESWQRIFTPLDCVADEVRRRWKVDPQELPLPFIPSGGTASGAPEEPEVRGLCGGGVDRRSECLSLMAGMFREACARGLRGWIFRAPQDERCPAIAGSTDAGDLPKAPGIVWFRCSGGGDCGLCDARWTACVSDLAGAMLEGLVPVVDAGPAVREVVRRCGSGFVCQSGAEMVSRTLALAGSPDVLADYSRKAWQAARELTESRFEERVASLIAALDRRQAA